MNKRPGYSKEVRERAVRLVLTGEHDHFSICMLRMLLCIPHCLPYLCNWRNTQGKQWVT